MGKAWARLERVRCKVKNHENSPSCWKDNEILSVTIWDIEVNALSVYVLCVPADVNVFTEHFTHGR